MKKILVTGGFGFIGTSLVELLVKNKQNKIHVVDDMSSSPIDVQDYLETIGKPQNLNYEIMTVDEFFRKKNVGHWDEIYHLASPVGPVGVLKHAGRMVQEVIRDGYSLIDYCLKRKTRLLNVSTSEIYGGGREGYCSENMPKIIPAETNVRLEYAIAKLAMETAIINNCRVYGLNAVIVRPFNIAGKRQSPRGGFVIPRFIQQAHKNEPITVFGNGSAIRAITHIRDMVRGLVLAMEKGKRGSAYNLGNPKNKTTILSLAKKIKKAIKSRSEIIFINPKTLFGNFYADANDKFPDAKKARKELGWIPKYSIEIAIQDAYDEYLRQFEKGVLKDKI